MRIPIAALAAVILAGPALGQTAAGWAASLSLDDWTPLSVGEAAAVFIRAADAKADDPENRLTLSRYEYPSPQGRPTPFRSVELLEEVNCSTGASRALAVRTYADNNLQALIANTDVKDAPWRTPAAGSIGEAVIRAACQAPDVPAQTTTRRRSAPRGSPSDPTIADQIFDDAFGDRRTCTSPQIVCNSGSDERFDRH